MYRRIDNSQSSEWKVQYYSLYMDIGWSLIAKGAGLIACPDDMSKYLDY